MSWYYYLIIGMLILIVLISGCADKCEKITDYLVGFKYIKFKKN